MNKNIRNRGFTLIELVISLVIFSISMLVMGTYFAFDYSSRTRLVEDRNFTTEARIAMHIMTQKLRFADPDSVVINNNSNKVSITATIIGGFLQDHPSHDSENVEVEYSWHRNDNPGLNLIANTITETYTGPEITCIIGNNITSFLPSRNATRLTLQLSAQAGTKEYPLQTTIEMLGKL
jgi:prepilin-type N-terminal cleavage/methylation domain-containing protein